MTTRKQSSLGLLGTVGVVTIGAVTGALVGTAALIAYTALIGKGTTTALATKGVLGLKSGTTSSASLMGLLFTSTGGALGGGVTSVNVVKKQVVQATNELESQVDELKQQLEISKSELVKEKQNNLSVTKIDLQQIKGIGPKYSKLLQEVGIDTVEELAQTSSKELYKMLDSSDSSTEKHLVKLDEWIFQAQHIVETSLNTQKE